MSLDTAPWEDAIEALALTVNPRVYISEVPADIETPLFPYVVLYFGGPIRAASDHHITSTVNDISIAYCTVQVVSGTDKSARDVANLLRKTLTGYRPPDCGEMGLEGGLAYSRGDNDTGPTRYFREVGYTFRTNLSWNE